VLDIQDAKTFCTTASLIVPTLLVAIFVAEIALPEPKGANRGDRFSSFVTRRVGSLLTRKLEQATDPTERAKLELALAELAKEEAKVTEPTEKQLAKERREAATSMLTNLGQLIVTGVFGEGFALLGSVNALSPKVCVALSGTAVMMMLNWLAHFAWLRVVNMDAMEHADPMVLKRTSLLVRGTVTLLSLVAVVYLWVHAV
jgi:hypothetical protein